MNPLLGVGFFFVMTVLGTVAITRALEINSGPYYVFAWVTTSIAIVGLVACIRSIGVPA